MSFWEKNVKNQVPVIQAQEITLDEEAMDSLQEDPEISLFEEEEDDIKNIMTDANLRLEQGRLYQMVLQGDIFADTNADPKAIKNVQREIRKFVKNRMEVMLGISQEQVEQIVVSSPFNDMEVQVLKMLASRMSKGESEKSGTQLPVAPVIAKKDSISSISGSVRPSPVVNAPKPLPKSNPNPIKKTEKSAIKKEELESRLTKPIHEMTPEELAAHDKAALEQRSKNYARIPNNLIPHPSPAELEMRYANQVAAHGSGQSTIEAITARMANPRQ